MNTRFRLSVVDLVTASVKRPLAVLLASLTLAVLALGYAAAHFSMTTDAASLISPKVAWRQNQARLDKAFPQLTGTMLIIIDGKTPELAEAGAAAMTERLTADTAHFEAVRRPDGGDFFARNGMLYGSIEDVRKGTAALVEAQPLLGPLAADPSLRGVSAALSTMLTGVEQGSATLEQIDKPMVALGNSLNAVAQGKQVNFSWMELFANGDAAQTAPLRRLILMKPKLDFGSLEPGETATNAARAMATELKLDPAHGTQMQITGEVPLADEEFETLEENIGFVGAVMALAMLATLWFALKSVKIVAAVVVTILAGLVITAAVGLLAVGSFNLISVAFIPLFVGLGVDFGIQIAVRFNAERLEGHAPADALAHAAKALGGPLVLAAGAVFLGFGAFLPTAYTGIAELGVIAGLGMVIALALSLTLLPALLILFKPGVPQREVGFAQAAPLDRFLEKHRKAVLWAFGASMLVTIALLPLVRFDFNPLHLRDPEAPSMRAIADLTRDPQRTPYTISVLAPDVAAANAIAAKLAKLPEVAQAVTLDSFVPADQEPKLQLIQDANLLLDLTLNPFETAPPPSNAETVTALTNTAAQFIKLSGGNASPAAIHARTLASALTRIADATPATRQLAEAMLVTPLNVMLNQVRASLQAEAVTRETIPAEIARDWVAPDGTAQVQVFPAGDSNDNAVIVRFTDALRKAAPNVAGLPLDTQEAAKTVAWAFVQAGLGALLLVSLLLFFVLRSVREVAFTLAPVVLSGFLTLGTCVLIGQPINFANIIAFPLLFGVGVAFHIYFVMAWRAGATDLLQSSLARAVLFSALATGTAFGSLWLSHHPGTASMGEILMISLAWTLVCALIFEPALLGPNPSPTHDPRQTAR